MHAEITIYITKITEMNINQSIKVLFKQNFDNFEIIIIDDGSSDNSKKIMKNTEQRKI